jgi:hypothetical protein
MKKAPYLKTLYLQKPLVLILLIAAVATLPWLGISNLLTETEELEFSVIQSFLKTGDIYLLNTFEAHSTLSRVIVAGFAYFSGEVTPYILRLPSALSFIALMGFCFMFFAHRRPVLEAFTSVLILITSFGIYFSSTIFNAYIFPSFLIVGGIFEMYRWLETRKTWKLVTTWLFWGAAVFELGWLVLVAPFISFLVYLLVRKKPVKEILINPLLMAVPPLLIGTLLFWVLPHSETETFTQCRSLANAECWDSFSFTGKVVAPLTGFLPWTLLLLTALLSVPFIRKSKETHAYNYPPVLPLDKVSQYNLLAAIVPLIGFLILPPSVLSEVFFVVCLLFTAIFLSRLIVHLSDMYPLVVRIFSIGITIASSIVLILSILVLFKWNSFASILDLFLNENLTNHITPNHSGGNLFIDLFLLAGLFVAIVVNTSFLFRRKNLKVLMATVGMIYALQLLVAIDILPDLIQKLHLLCL